MVTQALPRNPERVAWTVLLSSFATFVALLLTLVVGGRWWLLNAAVAQNISLVPTGTVPVTRPGRSLAEQGLTSVPVNAVVTTESNALADLTFTSDADQQVLARIQLLGDGQLRIEEASSPRFGVSQNPHRIVLRLTSGRLRALVGVDVSRPVEVIIVTDSGVTVRMTEPATSASVEATFTDTMVTVREGEAVVTANSASIALHKDERGEVRAGSPPTGPLGTDRNLVLNGDFNNGLDKWEVEKKTPIDPNEEAGTVDVRTIGGRRTVRFARTGSNWGQVGIRQQLNWSMQGFSSLRLHLEMLIAFQDLWNCGAVGTECPVMVRLDYTDIYGGSQEWLQGFYYNSNPNPNFGATVCAYCAVQWQHLEAPFGKWHVYESGNLIDVFNSIGRPIAILRSITIYGGGHSFNSFVTDVQLLAAE